MESRKKKSSLECPFRPDSFWIPDPHAILFDTYPEEFFELVLSSGQPRRQKVVFGYPQNFYPTQKIVM
jgi:hypothetical protein